VATGLELLCDWEVEVVFGPVGLAVLLEVDCAVEEISDVPVGSIPSLDVLLTLPVVVETPLFDVVGLLV